MIYADVKYNSLLIYFQIKQVLHININLKLSKSSKIAQFELPGVPTKMKTTVK